MQIFISYARADLESFKIADVATALEQHNEIEKVYYWDRDNKAYQTIRQYMEEKVEISDVILTFCSKNSNDSGPVQEELEMALYLGKTIVPIFKDVDDLSLSLKIKRGVEYHSNDFDGFMQDLMLILSKSEKSTNLTEKLFSMAKNKSAKLSIQDKIRKISAKVGETLVQVEQIYRNSKGFLLDDQISGLGLANSNLTSFPDLNDFETLKRLSLLNNQVEFLPDNMPPWDLLTHLWLGNNNITYIPNWFKEISNLEILDLSNNKLGLFPSILLKDLKKLKLLDLSHNLLNSFNGKELPSDLSYVNLKNNKIRKIDWKFEDAIPNLKHISISNNPLTEIPDNFGNFKQLEILELDNTHLKSLPDEIANLPNLRYLYVHNSDLMRIPESFGKLQSLEKLWIFMTKIEQLPESMSDLSNLKTIYLDLGIIQSAKNKKIIRDLSRNKTDIIVYSGKKRIS
ncbi:MAG: TIR domain-containing protein [Candidatus Lokiarchaeota archaeon]|nr:TIR domain-containing protein [Candidatus Lokiarchaeota archaeon]